MTTGQQIYDEARAWVGVPFQHQGRNKFGVDCVGLVVCVNNKFTPMPEMMRPQLYARRPMGELVAELESRCLRLDEVEQGCVVLVQWHRTDYPAHVAIYGDGNIVHSYQAAGRVVEVGYRAKWLEQTVGFFRLPGVTP